MMTLGNVKAKNLLEGDVLLDVEGRNRRIKNVYRKTFWDAVTENGQRYYQSYDKTYLIIPDSRGRGLELVELDSQDFVRVRSPLKNVRNRKALSRQVNV